MIAENDMLKPVLTLFPHGDFHHFEQVPLGRKTIDLVCVPRDVSVFTSVELKVSDWRRAVWQAVVNFQLTDYSYIALWHEFVHRPVAEIELLKHYGIGLMTVYRTTAKILLPSATRPRKVPRRAKYDWYCQLLAST